MRSFAVLSICMASAVPAWATGCLDEVERLAKAHDIATNPPTVDPDSKRPESKVTPEELGRSGGVIEPPVTNDRSVIRPPDTPSNMPTMPNLATPAPMKQDRGKDGLTAPDTTSLQGLLVAARADAEEGREAGCREKLDKARGLIARAN